MRYKYVYGYLRLSRDDEDRQDESNSIANQRLLIRQYIKGNKEFEGACIQFCADDGYSGTNYNRPEFQRMMELVKENTSCCLIVKDDCEIIGLDRKNLTNTGFLRHSPISLTRKG